MRKIYCDIRKCLSCYSCEVACALCHSKSNDIYQAAHETPRPKHLVRVNKSDWGPFPLRCHHCEDAPCIDACKSGATHRDPETGKVLIDRDKCVGCWMCVMVCPFGAVSPDYETGTAIKCDLCEGHEKPACAEACPTNALYFVEYEDFEKEYKKQKPEKIIVSSSERSGL